MLRGAPQGEVRASWAGEVGEICLDRPSKRNALNESMLVQLKSEVERLKGNPGLRAVILRGKGPVFCAGADLEAFRSLQGGKQRQAWRLLGRTSFASLAQLGVPVIAVVQGGAFGGGVELALHCQVRVASPEAVFALPEMSMGWEPEWGALDLLPELIGRQAADDLLRSGRRVPADEALRLGLVSVVTSDPESYARRLAARICEERLS